MSKKEFDNDPTLPPDVDLNRIGIHLFMSDVDESSCKDAIEFILKHNHEKKKKPYLKMMICSNGGDVPCAFALIDVIKASKIPIHTVGLGCIASCGLLIFIAGEPQDAIHPKPTV
jgi:ATP-dependent Clp protease protease subunit